MNEIIAFLQQNKYGSLATCNDSKADVRPFELVFYCDRGLFFYTSAGEDVYSQLCANPYISFCATDQAYNYAKVSGTVAFSNSEDDKAKILSNSRFAQTVFANSAVGDMKVFFLPHASCKLHYFAEHKISEWQF